VRNAMSKIEEEKVKRVKDKRQQKEEMMVKT